MSSPIGLSEGCRGAIHLREAREANTVILRFTETPGVLGVEVEGNLPHEELVAALPAEEVRLVVHELSFATPEGARRHERLLVFRMPADASAQVRLLDRGPAERRASPMLAPESSGSLPRSRALCTAEPRRGGRRVSARRRRSPVCGA